MISLGVINRLKVPDRVKRGIYLVLLGLLVLITVVVIASLNAWFLQSSHRWNRIIHNVTDSGFEKLSSTHNLQLITYNFKNRTLTVFTHFILKLFQLNFEEKKRQ